MVIQNGPCDEEEGYVHMLLIPVTNEGKSPMTIILEVATS